MLFEVIVFDWFLVATILVPHFLEILTMQGEKLLLCASPMPERTEDFTQLNLVYMR